MATDTAANKTQLAMAQRRELWHCANKGPHRGVLFVHGGGPQDQSNTLLTCGGPLIDWLRTFWASARGPRVAGAPVLPEVGETVLDFSPLDDGDNGGFSRASVFLPNSQRWTLAEAWWAKSVLPPSTLALIPWYWARMVALWIRILNTRPCPETWRQYYFATKEHGFRFGGLIINLAAWFTKLDVIVAEIIEAVVLPFAAVLAEVLPFLQGFALTNAGQVLLRDSVGEIKLYEDDEIQAANLRRRVAAGVTLLIEKGCEDVTIVAHSLGAVVCYGMLSDPAYEEIQKHVRKFITLGEGLNWFWKSERHLDRLQRPIAPNIYWVDVWASFDSGPAGALRPPTLPNGTRVVVYCPDDKVRKEQGLPLLPADNVPTEVEVMNELDPFDDHNRYFRNDEEVLPRLAAEIDATNYCHSIYWPGKDSRVMRKITDDRRKRLAWLAFGRLIWGAGQTAIYLLAIAQLLQLPGSPFKELGSLMTSVPPIRWLDGWVMNLPGVELLHRVLQQWPKVALIAGIIWAWIFFSIIWAVPYNLVVHGIWGLIDRHERQEAIGELANGKRPRGA